MEYVVSGKDVDGEQAERIGRINKASDTASEMDSYMDELVSRLVLFPLSRQGMVKQYLPS